MAVFHLPLCDAEQSENGRFRPAGGQGWWRGLTVASCAYARLGLASNNVLSWVGPSDDRERDVDARPWHVRGEGLLGH